MNSNQDQDQILKEAVAIVCSEPTLSNADLIDIVIETTETSYAIAEKAVAKAIRTKAIPPVSSCEEANSATTREVYNDSTISVNRFLIAIAYFIIMMVSFKIVTNFIIGGSITDLIQELSKEERR